MGCVVGERSSAFEIHNYCLVYSQDTWHKFQDVVTDALMLSEGITEHTQNLQANTRQTIQLLHATELIIIQQQYSQSF